MELAASAAPAAPAEVAGLTFVLGGVRSGKSLWAEARLLARAGAEGEAGPGRGRSCVYLATADSAALAEDEALAERVARHKARRGPGWRTVEEPLNLAHAVAGAGADAPLLLDSLTLWLARWQEEMAQAGPGSEGALEDALDGALAELLAALAARRAPSVAVADEVGLGGVAAHPVARRFADLSGRMNAAFAKAAAEVVLVAAGLPLCLKGGGAESAGGAGTAPSLRARG